MFAGLMGTRRFAPLFWCQFLSAFNDNFVRTLLGMMLLFRVGHEAAEAQMAMAVALFIAPSIVLSGLGGQIADAHDKALIARRLKFAEIFVQMIAAAGVFTGQIYLLFAALFGLGVISALFGPIKYGILPDHLKTEELPAGNALVEGATFLAILLGIAAGGFAVKHGVTADGAKPWSVVAQLMAVAVACWLTARQIPSTAPAAPDLKPEANILSSTTHLVRELYADGRLWTLGVGLSLFWMTGAVALTLVAALVKTRLGGDVDVEMAIHALFAVGVALGSILAAVIAHGRVFLSPAPFATLGLALFLFDLGFATYGAPPPAGELGLSAFFGSGLGLRVSLDVAGVAFMGGLFAVPLFAAVQAWSAPERRARVVAAVNVVNSLFIVAGSVAAAGAQAAGVGQPALLVALGLVNVFGAWYLFRMLPSTMWGDLLNLYFRLFHRVEVRGLEHLKAAGERAVIAVNHVSFADAPLILSLMEDKPVFAIDSGIAKAWWVKPFLGIARVFPMDPTKAMGTRGLIQEVREGRKLVIFPEGRITVTGSLMKVYDGAAMIADKADANIVPVRIEGLERSFFSRLSGDMIRRALFPKTVVTFMPPRRLGVDAALKGRKRRQAAGAALAEVMTDLIFKTSDLDQTIFQSFVATTKHLGASRIVLEDPITGALTGRKTLIGAALLARKIEALTAPGEPVAILLPNANGAAVTFLAVQQAGRVAAMLNFTAGAANLATACATAQTKVILTSKNFVEKTNLGGVVEMLAKTQKIVWLEDLRAGAGLADKLRAVWESGRTLSPRKPTDPAAILFTSGSEGAPKGVALSHRNILANVAQIESRYDITPRDVVFNVLPVFHSFGLTGGMILPLISGMKCYLYPSPLHYRQIPELIYGCNATVLFGTDTFLAGYARTANPYDFRSLRYVVAGAEPVKAETRRIYMEKFGLRIMEGYGVTEGSPVLAVNDPMMNKAGTVGRLMPDIEHRLEAVPGIEEGGRLFVRGPNIMAGYYLADAPGVLKPPHEGWHDTGDIVTVDAQGFVTIKGRAKRFAKIAGEMVSLAQVEQMLADYSPEQLHAVVAAPDAKKGERLILVTTAREATKSAVQQHLKSKGANELMAPSEIMIVDAIPLLGSGKTDYVQLARLVNEKLAKAAA